MYNVIIDFSLLFDSDIFISFVTNRHALLPQALQTARQIEIAGNSIRSAESIRIDYSHCPTSNAEPTGMRCRPHSQGPI